MATQHGVAPDLHSSPGALIKSLHDINVLSSETERALLGLVQLRNLAAHAPGEELSARKALDFITLASALLWTLDGTPRS